jgi:hypothetical protein
VSLGRGGQVAAFLLLRICVVLGRCLAEAGVSSGCTRVWCRRCSTCSGWVGCGRNNGRIERESLVKRAVQRCGKRDEANRCNRFVAQVDCARLGRREDLDYIVMLF